MNTAMRNALELLWLGWLCLAGAPLAEAVESARGLEIVVPGIEVIRGPVNGVQIERNGRRLLVYGDPREEPAAADAVLFTHHRRDVVWAGRGLVSGGARAIVPAAETNLFSGVDRFWALFETNRFHDYSQQTTKVLGEPMRVSQPVRGGEVVRWEGLPIRVLDTPGYTRGAVSYVIEQGGQRIVMTGDLIVEDGKLLDLYSLQDALPEAKVGGYHGYAARLGDLISSLRRVASEEPDILVPSRGPVIREPRAAIETLIRRIQAFYANYLAIDALRYYFGDSHMQAKARRVLEPGAAIDWLPMAKLCPELPEWILRIGNSRLVVSADRSGFLVDCGSPRILEQIEKLLAEGRIRRVEHVFITHYHDDHTDQVAKLVERCGATVHATRFNWDILERPGDYRLPCLTAHPIRVSGRSESGARWRWKEFEVAIDYFPGQTLYHDALWMKRDGGEQVYFIGDSFTPSGIDDYCLLNRNLLEEGGGYFRCLDILRAAGPDVILINEHVDPGFRFSAGQIGHMTEALRRRAGLLGELLAGDGINFGLDESWARFHPYAVSAGAGRSARLGLRVMNHASVEREYTVRIHPPAGWAVEDVRPNPIRIPAHTEGEVALSLQAEADAAAGWRLVTADLEWPGGCLREWTEAMVSAAQGPQAMGEPFRRVE
ncbi:MAG TPA: MBL fold metallo-hydrolase [Candidatus Paceibacterota bacterium]|nr:MBL fold metallo-hydrolase [Candidatus Paceibacterota bacterium]